jgi:hypothetical protein
VAERLAVLSDEVALRLEGGDNCGALAEGAQLRDELTVAVERGVVPEVYVREVSRIVNEIQAEIPPCEEAQVPPPPRDRREDDEEDD